MDLLIIAILAAILGDVDFAAIAILGGAGYVIYRSKKSGHKCIGCPSGGGCAGCSGNCGN